MTTGGSCLSEATDITPPGCTAGIVLLRTAIAPPDTGGRIFSSASWACFLGAVTNAEHDSIDVSVEPANLLFQPHMDPFERLPESESLTESECLPSDVAFEGVSNAARLDRFQQA